VERLRSLTLLVKQQLARRSRLEAERDGASMLPIPVQLAKLAGERTARTFLAAESTVLRAEQARRLQQGKEIALRIAAARNEVEALKRKLDQIDVQKNMRTERLDDLVAVAQAEARLSEAEEANARLSSENTANLANAITTVDKEVAVAQDAIIFARTLATMLYRSNGRALQAVAYEIVRQSKDGAGTLEATETSPLMPGDVLKINPKVAAINPSSVAPVPQSEPTPPYIQTAIEN